MLEGKFLKRYKRFFADFELNGKLEVAHVANTGSMKSCNLPGSACLVSPSSNPERKLKFTLEAIKAPTGSWVGVNTSRPNQMVKKAFEEKLFPHWKVFDHIQAEVKINSETRLDFLLSNEKTKRYVEVKNVTLAESINGQLWALFPDAVTERGQKHLKELMHLMDQGFEAEIVFIVQRQDCQGFAPADKIDPEYGKLFRLACEKGLVVSAFQVDISPEGFKLTAKQLKVAASFWLK